MKRTAILIIGGTGVFGRRLVRHLAGQGGLAVYVGSRSVARAAAFIETVTHAKAALRPVAVDCAVNLDACLSDVRPFIVVDCSGPFQGAGYDTAHAVLAGGAHFIDLADARDYLAGFSRALDDTARMHGVSAWTGASSTPTLSTCVVRAMTTGWQSVEAVDICITPGGRSEVGQSVIAAILSYAGKSVPIWRDGKLGQTTGWGDARSVDIAGLGRRRVAMVETYDAEYLGPLLAVTGRVSFAAGLESRLEQWGIEAMAALRKRGWLGNLDALIPALLQLRKVTRIPTTASGGMQVEISGGDGAAAAKRVVWSLVAHRDHGPYIPILPAAAVIAKLIAGAPAAGAAFAHELVSLDDILDEMQPYDIATSQGSGSPMPAANSSNINAADMTKRDQGPVS